MNYYNHYQPEEMLSRTSPFHNYVKDNFFELSNNPSDIIFDDTDPGTVGSTADKFNWCFREVLYTK